MTDPDKNGRNVNRIDAVAKVTGAALYPGDLVKENMLHMKILFARRPHAIIRRIDIVQAEQVPGVKAIFTAKDVPNNEYGLIIPDQPVLIGPGSNKQWGDRVRFIGDQVALIVADSEKTAERARDLIVVEYEDLPILSDPREAIKDGAIQLHPDKANNILQHYRVRKGDVDSIWSKCNVIVESEYHTPFQEHAYLQPEAGLSYIDEEGRITVQVGGQWTHEDQEQIAHALRLPLERVRVIYPAIGGAFGGREDMSVQIVLALATWKLQRPVKIVWSREESMIGHHKRHPMYLKAKWGARSDGKLLAAEIHVISDAGAYAYTSTKVQGNTTLTCTGPYEIPNVKVDTYSVFTNNIPTGAFRGFGGPQGEFLAEMQMNKLADKLSIDPVELRLMNVLREGSILSVGTPIPKGISMTPVLEKCALEVGWTKNLEIVESNLSMPSKILSQGWIRPPRTSSTDPSKRIGLGFAIGYKNVGFSFGAPEQSTARIELHGTTEIEEAILYHASAEVGQGTHTVMRQMAARALDMPIEKVQLIASDTATSGNSGSVSASRMTFMSGNSIKGAAELALKKWHEEERPAIAEYSWKAPKTTPFDPETGKSEPNFAYGYVAEAVEVEVDIETGHVRVLRVWCADDVGRAINPELVRGQIEGGIVQAQGYTITENFQMKDGQVLTPYLSNYLIPTVLDIPQKITSIILEYPDPLGPWGARGMAEMPYLPYAPAVCAAVKDAIGIWFDSFPLTPDRVLKALKTK
ncbi:MAG TPA: xanthine dehydrogenase family protein molybdopterin-binding subunit [Anaerolineae bacterium]|nr:xanthine dehydrogenase family protein molybdopterin-binding subunit [Anaerolineae bacterium]